MRRAPFTVSNFKEMREGNFFYVDKTPEIYNLVTNYYAVFLSRPPIFGKTLLIDTIKCLFEGKKELFEGLYIYDKWD